MRGVSEVAGEVRRARIGFGAAWGVAMTGAILLWVAVAALAPRAEQGLVVGVDVAGGTLTLDPVHPEGLGSRTLAIPRDVSVQRFDERLSLADLRPGQWVEMSVRMGAGAVPTVTSIRIIREGHGSVSAGEPGAPSKEDARPEPAPTTSGSAGG
jgi:hypothetical protein